MAEKKTAKKPVNPSTLKVQDGVDGVKAGMTDSQVIATVMTRSGMSATTLKAYANAGDFLEVTDLMTELVKAGDEVVAGDMGRMERMLTHQAITLNTMFNRLATRANSQEYMKTMDTYMRLALKSQTQCRSTVEALALLKNPQPYIRQANIAQGHQQVNNTYATASGHSGIPSCAENSQSLQNKLLETDHGQRLDIGAQATTGRVDTQLEAVGAVNRA